MRRLLLTAALSAAALAGGCDEQTETEGTTAPLPVGRDGFMPIGRFTDAGAGAWKDAEPFTPPRDRGVDPPLPDAEVRPPPPPLQLRFVPIQQDSGALRITDIAFLPAPAGELLVLDKDGEVVHLRLDGDRAQRLGSFTVADTFPDSDAGLVSIALDPDFARNRFLYLGVTISRETNVIRRYTWHGSDYAATLASETLIIEVTGERSPRSWHNVGSIGFTEEGYLWALFGDKVLDQYARDPASPLGKLLRIIPSRDPDEGGYLVPEDNPFADGSGHPAVYAMGMRSPWKGLYRRGRWMFGDVGLDTYEEVNVVSAPGQDFGWPDAEGPCTTGDCEGITDPWFYYGRSSREALVRDNPSVTSARLRSVWIGWEYQPTGNDRYDGRWDGVVTFGDAYLGSVRCARADGRGGTWHCGHFPMITAWAQAPDGYVYVTALGTWPIDAPVTPSPILRAVPVE